MFRRPYYAHVCVQERDTAEEQHEELDSVMHGKWCLLDANITTLNLLLPLESSGQQPRPSAYDELFNGIEQNKGINEVGLSRAFISTVNNARDTFAPHTLVPIDIESGLKDPSKDNENVSAYWWCSASDGDAPHPELQCLWLAFTKDEYEDDMFGDDDTARLQAGDEDRRKIRAELIACAEAIMKQHQRTHLFSVLILGSCCRIFRWDRAGACVTKKFNYVKHPEILGEFLWRLSHSTAEMQGHDSSAVLVMPGTEEYLLMDQMARDGDRNQDTHFDYIRQLFAASLIERWPRYRLEVEDAKRGSRYFLVGKPQFAASGLASRGTRSYVGIDVQDGVFVHLKDQWRFDTPNVTLEGDVIEKLNDAGVKNVPTLVCHGDVRGQHTKTQDYWMDSLESASIVRIHNSDDERETRPPKKLVHYRIVEKEVGKPLKEFQDSRALVFHILDGITAHRDAVDMAEILHRDVSADNLLIYPLVQKNEEGVITHVSWTGLLIDWESSKSIAASGASEEGGRNDCVGTWQFMSAHILNDKHRPPSIQDELESFFHVLFYYAIRYLRHNIPNVDQYISAFFDEYIYEDGEYRCGIFKGLVMREGVATLLHGSGRVHFGSLEEDHPLNELMDELLTWFGAYYRVVDHDNLTSQSSPSSPASSSRGSHIMLGRTRGSQINEKTWIRVQTRLQNRSIKRRTDEQIAIDRKLAANLDTHAEIRETFKAYLALGTWPSDDRSPRDQLRRDSSPSAQKQGGECSNCIPQTNNYSSSQSKSGKGTKRGPEAPESNATPSNKRRKSSPPPPEPPQVQH